MNPLKGNKISERFLCMIELKRKDLLHPELSFKIIGCAFEVHNELGYGFKEVIYQKALSLAYR